jgi:hypothetical protein
VLLAAGTVAAVPTVAGAHGTDDHGSAHHDGSSNGEQHDTTHLEQHGSSKLIVHDCSGRDRPTDEDEADAEAFIEAVTTGIESYQDVSVAEADGFRITDQAAMDPSPVDHYMQTARGRSGDRDELHPKHPDGLVYFSEDDGSHVLLGAVWRSRAECPPQPAGPLTVWHDHSPSGCPDAHPDCPLATGEVVDSAHVPKMFHVWVFEGVAEPFAHDFFAALGRHGGDQGRPPGEHEPRPDGVERV